MLRKKQSMQEHLERMKYVSKYAINETPKYKSLVGNSGMDALPEYLMKEAAPTEPDANAAPAADPNAASAPEAGGADASGLPAIPDVSGGGGGGAPASAAPAPAAAPPAPPASNTNVDITTAPAPSTQPEPMMGGQDQMSGGVDSPEKRVMELQLDALRKMSSTIEDLGSSIDSLNQRMEIYSNEVEKVREPSDLEKFENRKVDSSPYYFNLNDLWKDDNFKSRMDQFSKGYVKTEDGYVADFDDLPKLAPHEVKASFDI
jgi:hypothetical protein